MSSEPKTLQFKKLGQGRVQPCPLCGMQQEIFIDGLRPHADGIHMERVKDKGYSFCNCRNIFFTDWKNIELGTYDQAYNDRYQRPEIVVGYENQVSKFMPIFRRECPEGAEFLEIGSINDFILDGARKYGYLTTGLDINVTRKSLTHSIVHGNVEDNAVQDKLAKYDIVWAAHIFEHFKEPLKVAATLLDKLNPGGLLYVAMPDPFFIDWNSPYSWCHWHIREHHILWDMDSFIDALIEMGYQIVHSQRHSGIEFLNTSGDFHLIFRKA